MNAVYFLTNFILEGFPWIQKVGSGKKSNFFLFKIFYAYVDGCLKIFVRMEQTFLVASTNFASIDDVFTLIVYYFYMFCEKHTETYYILFLHVIPLLISFTVIIFILCRYGVSILLYP